MDLLNNEEIPKKYYYHGEFGFFNVILLGSLEKYFNKTKKTIIVTAHTNFIKILKILFPNNIIGIPYIKLEKEREYHHTPNIISSTDSIELVKFLNIGKSLMNDMTYISSPIIYNNTELKDKYKKEFVVIFPRNREGKFAHRNMDINVFYNIVEVIKKYNYEIICIGHPEEVLLEAKTKFNYVEDLEETIYLLNNTKLLIAPDSGFIDFAKNCATKNIIMVYNKSHINYHYSFLPFKSRFSTIDISIKDISTNNYIDKLNNYITKYLV